MSILRRSLALCLAGMMMAPVARAQQPQHAIDQAALDSAIQLRVAQQQADREAIRTLLRRAEVRDVAAKAGLSIARADAAISVLQADELRELAQQARHVENDLAGGASTVVISTTTIIIILLLIILIVVIAD